MSGEMLTGNFPTTDDPEVAKLFIAWTLVKDLTIQGVDSPAKIDTRLKWFKLAYDGLTAITEGEED